MGCCGKVKQIAQGYTGLAIEKMTGKKVMKYEFTDDRIRICQKCDENYWIKKTLWCSICKCFVPAAARIKEKKCEHLEGSKWENIGKE